jgi:DNA-binding Lrp family transcriptional regulator
MPETEGFIRSYRAEIDRTRLGFGFMTIVSMTLATHNRDNAKRFAKLVASLPEVLEAHSLTGEMDYALKVVTPDLPALSRLVNDRLLPHESVQHVHSAIVLETLKDFAGLPLSPPRAPAPARRRRKQATPGTSPKSL